MSFYPYKRLTPSQLIGLKFKRKKYGLSTWTDTITNVVIHLEYNYDFKEYAPKCIVTGARHNYDIDEIIIMDKKVVKSIKDKNQTS